MDEGTQEPSNPVGNERLMAGVGIVLLVLTVVELVSSSRASVRGASARAYLLATAVVSGVVIGIATVPAQHHWVNLPRDHRHHDRQHNASVSDARGRALRIPWPTAA